MTFLPGGFPIIDPVTRLCLSAAPEIQEVHEHVAEQMKGMAARCGLKVERVIPVENGVAYPQYATLQFVRIDTNEGTKKKTRRERWGRDGAYLMVRFGHMEKSTYGPPNFYHWSRRAKLHFLLKRWPNATGCCNGVPWELPDSHAVHIPHQHKLPAILRQAA